MNEFNNLNDFPSENYILIQCFNRTFPLKSILIGTSIAVYIRRFSEGKAEKNFKKNFKKNYKRWSFSEGKRVQ